MENKKKQTTILSIFLLIIAICLGVYFTKSSYSYTPVAEQSTYKDFDRLPTYLDTRYSYSTWLLTKDTTSRVIKKPTKNGRSYSADPLTIDGHTLYNFGWELSEGFDGGEAIVLVRNSALNANGDGAEVIYALRDNINKFGLTT